MFPDDRVEKPSRLTAFPYPWGSSLLPSAGTGIFRRSQRMMPWVILPLETAFKMIHWGCPVEYKEMDGFNNTPLPQNIPQKFSLLLRTRQSVSRYFCSDFLPLTSQHPFQWPTWEQKSVCANPTFDRNCDGSVRGVGWWRKPLLIYAYIPPSQTPLHYPRCEVTLSPSVEQIHNFIAVVEATPGKNT